MQGYLSKVKLDNPMFCFTGSLTGALYYEKMQNDWNNILNVRCWLKPNKKKRFMALYCSSMAL